MKQFKDIIKKYRLEELSPGYNGTLYTNEDENPEIFVRHFNGNIPPELIPAYTTLFSELYSWVKERPEVRGQVEVQKVTEIGEDYIVVPFQICHVTLGVIDEFPQIFEQLNCMQEAVRSAIGSANSLKDKIIEEVVTSSLLDESPFTIYEDYSDRFIIIEPYVSREILERWHALQQS